MPKVNANRVRIMKQVKVNNVWQLYPVQLDAAGRVTDTVLINGQPERHTEGQFYLEWRQNGKRRRELVKDKRLLLDEARRKYAELQALRSGIEVTGQEPITDRKKLSDAIDEFLKWVDRKLKNKTYLSYEYIVKNVFQSNCTKLYMDQIEHQDLVDFIAFCEDQEWESGSIRYRVRIVRRFLNYFGIEIKLKKHDWPSAVDSVPEQYTPEELEALFVQATEGEATMFKFYLGSGLRDQECRYMTWADVDAKHNQVRVRQKPLWGFTPKNWEERTVRIPSTLMSRLMEWKEKRQPKPTDPVFPNSVGRPDQHHDRILKRIAQEAELNCGQCVTRFGNKCADGPYCERFHLHKFRHTFAIECLRSGMNIKDLQSQLGHKDLKTTMIYLRAYTPHDLGNKVDNSTLAAMTD